MLTRLKNWIQGSRRKSGDQWEAHRGHLSEQEKHLVDTHETASAKQEMGDAIKPEVFDETRRGRPPN